MEDWITRCLAAAAKKQSIHAATSKAIENVLRGDGGCRRLTGAETLTAAGAILAANESAEPTELPAAQGAAEQPKDPPIQGVQPGDAQ